RELVNISEDNPLVRRLTAPPCQPTSGSWWWIHLMAPKIPTHTYKLFKLRCTSVGGMTSLAINFSLRNGHALADDSYCPYHSVIKGLCPFYLFHNSAKRFKVVDLFDIRQAKGENLKSYLARFNNATVPEGVEREPVQRCVGVETTN
ncbi:hypothetical protein CR513_43943, partial [Mucuna pruriens]